MNIPIERQVKAPNSAEFTRLLAGFATEGYHLAGIGAVVIRDGQFLTTPDAQVETTLLYVPYEADQPLIPPDAVEMLDEYDPDKEFVLAVLGPDGRAMCLRLEIANTHLPPRSRNVPYMAGAVLQLKIAIGDIQPGYYLFKGERGAAMRITSVVMDDDEGDLVPADTEVEVHSDFCELFERTDATVNPRWL